jgi:HAD superfamily hydrolase (TIGR01549 family)
MSSSVRVSPRSRPRWEVRAILFDLDDTIFDHTRTAKLALAAVRRGRAPLQARSLNDVAVRYSQLLDEIYPSVLAGRTTHERARVERFSRLLRWSGTRVDESTAQEISDEYRARYQELRRAVPGAKELLRSIPERITVGIVSNNHHAEQLEKLRAIRLDRAFDFVLTSEKAGVAKPDPGIFRVALGHAGCEPGEAVMVGDSWAFDVLGARAAGLRAVWFNRRRLHPPQPIAIAQLYRWSPAGRVADWLVLGGAAPRRAPGRPTHGVSPSAPNG